MDFGGACMSTLQIRLFGTLTLDREGQQLAPFPTQSVKHLLSYILLHRHVLHTREYLANLLWLDRDSHRARHCLNTALWRLQRVLASDPAELVPYLRVDAHSIGLNTQSNLVLDVAEFERYCALADQARPTSPELQVGFYERATVLYRADLLTDCYEDWCLIERQRLQHMYLRALAYLFTFYIEQQRHDLAIDIGQRILECDPLREEVHRDLIRLYLAMHQPVMALRQYRTCEALLNRELGVAPMPETQAPLHEILAARSLYDMLNEHDSEPQHSEQPTLGQALAQLNTAMIALNAARDQVQHATTLVETALQRSGRTLESNAKVRQLPHD
jgi:DNA-binding SARP family transcriptional activator